VTVFNATIAQDVGTNITANYGSAKSTTSKLVRFSTDAVGTERKSVLIEQFLGE
jgi:hypothetical protein